MNPWIMIFGYLVLGFCLIVAVIASSIQLIRRKHRKKNIRSAVISLVTSSACMAALIIFIVSHATYYKYNDWVILHSNIYTVQQKYGDFDWGVIREHQAGTAAYYIYTDNGPIMPDHLKHYYYMDYDENGVIYHIYESGQIGG